MDQTPSGSTRNISWSIPAPMGPKVLPENTSLVPEPLKALRAPLECSEKLHLLVGSH